ncbi:hypothetical protein BZA70DRAFT_284788, partial [Myxozyma melibiosi]
MVWTDIIAKQAENDAAAAAANNSNTSASSNNEHQQTENHEDSNHQDSTAASQQLNSPTESESSEGVLASTSTGTTAHDDHDDDDDNLSKTATETDETDAQPEKPGQEIDPAIILPQLIHKIDPPTQQIRRVEPNVSTKIGTTSKRRICGIRLPIAICALLLIALAVGLGAGLGVGLNKNKSSSASTAPSSPSSPASSSSSTSASATESSTSSATSTATVVALQAATETPTARDTISEYGSVKSSFCTPDASILGFLQANFTVELMDFQFYSSYWLDGSDAGLVRQIATAKDDVAEITGEEEVTSVFATCQVDSGREYIFRVSLKYIIDSGYNKSEDLTAYYISIVLGSTSVTDDLYPLNTTIVSQSEAITYNDTTITLERRLTIPDSLDIANPNNLLVTFQATSAYQTTYLYLMTLTPAANETCSGPDPDFSTRLVSPHDVDVDLVVRANSDFANISALSTTIESSYCIPPGNVTLSPRFESIDDWSSVSADVGSTTFAYTSLNWTDGSSGGVYLAPITVDLLSGSETQSDPVSLYQSLQLNSSTEYKLRLAFKIVLLNNYDDYSSDIPAIAISVPSSSSSSSSPLFQYTLSRSEVDSFALNDTTMTVIGTFTADSDDGTVVQFNSSAVMQYSFLYLASVYTDTDNSTCGYSDPNYELSAVDISFD